jgi:hypothetical protein
MDIGHAGIVAWIEGGERVLDPDHGRVAGAANGIVGGQLFGGRGAVVGIPVGGFVVGAEPDVGIALVFAGERGEPVHLVHQTLAGGDTAGRVVIADLDDDAFGGQPIDGVDEGGGIVTVVAALHGDPHHVGGGKALQQRAAAGIADDAAERAFQDVDALRFECLAVGADDLVGGDVEC